MTKQTDLLCALESECDEQEEDGGWDFGVDLLNGESCRDARERELDRCVAACDYDDDAARECMRELKQAERATDCSLDDVDLSVCAAVFTDCEVEEGEEPLHCEVEEPQYLADSSTCTVAADANRPGAWALLLGLAVAVRRRRARFAGPS